MDKSAPYMEAKLTGKAYNLCPTLLIDLFVDL